MTSETPSTPSSLLDIVQITLDTLAERNDPLIERVNAGGVLTNEEAKDVFWDLYNLTRTMIAAGKAVESADRLLEAKDKEIETLTKLLGL